MFITNTTSNVTFGVSYTNEWGVVTPLPKGGTLSTVNEGALSEALDPTGEFVTGISFVPNGAIGVASFSYTSSVGTSTTHVFEVAVAVAPAVVITDPVQS